MFVEYKQDIIDSKVIIKVIVQKGTSCPYFLANYGICPEGVYIRQNTSIVPAAETAILQMIKETDGEKYENLRALNQKLTFIEAAKEFSTRNMPFDIDQQMALKLTNSDDIYTNLGLLLSDQCMHTVKLAVFEGTEKTVFKDRHEFTGSLLKQLNDTFKFIDRCNRSHSEIDSLYRTDIRDYPVESVREALLNAFIHRDYSFSESSLINIFDDRIEFVSIGGLIKGITFEDMILGISITRNKNLANVFYRLALVEAYGIGIPKIMLSYKNVSAKPHIETTASAFKITLPSTNEILEETFVSENEHIVTSLFRDKKFITRKDVETALSISQTMAIRLLKELRDKNEIRAIGSGKNTRYLLVK
jgi:ATP-dependent DNA helicase RecG